MLMWGLVDDRTGQRVSVMAFNTKESAERQLQQWRVRDAKGGRQDIHDALPFFVPIEIRPEDWYG